MKLSSGLIAAAVCGLASTPAFSTSTASASIGPLNIQLVDLDTTDNVTPWITFQSDSSNASSVSISVPTQDGGGSSASPFYGSSLWTANTISGISDGGNAQASISGNGTATGTTFAASATATGFSGPDANATRIRAFAGAGGSPVDFSLSANTLVVISGTGSVSASVVGTNGGAFLTFASLRMEGLGSLGTGVQSAWDNLLRIGDYDVDRTFSVSDSRKLSVSFVNLLSDNATGTFRTETEVRVGSVTTAVPEPETYALMFAGLAAIGLLASRRG